MFRATAADAARRLLGVVLLALVVLPVFRVLDPSQALESRMAASAEMDWRVTWAFGGGGVALAALAVALAVAAVTRGRVVTTFTAAGRIMSAAPRSAFAAAVGLLGCALTLLVAVDVFDQRTILNDASVQLIQARYFAAGMLAGPVLTLPEFWSIQFMIHTAAGWVSQYPPGHAVLLAGGMRAGSALIPMVLAVGIAGGMLVLALERLVPEARGEARLAGLLVAASPFLLGLAAGYMNHATLAAAAVAALYFALRAQDGSPAWTLAAGAAMGLMVTLRPVTGLALGLLLTAPAWLGRVRAGRAAPESRHALARRLGWWVAGGLPFAVAFGWFNARFFGSPVRLGYVAASGPNHALGFHEDPHGRMYTAIAAVGNVSAELLSLSRELLGTPLPLVALVGLFLVAAPRLDRGARLCLAWATITLLCSALYWHHDLVFGPRMIGEAAPAWVVLAVSAAIWLVRRVRGAGEAGDATAPSPPLWRLVASDALALAFFAALVFGAVAGGPERLRLRGNAVAPVPAVDHDGPTLVFVHESWGDRLGARLSARGMRLDSVRAALRSTPPCQIEVVLRQLPPDRAAPTCRREQASDALIQRFGALGLTSLLWTGDLPGLPPEGVMWVQDMGPERNRDLLDAYPDRTPLFALPTARGTWEVVPYAQGVNTVWSPSLAPAE